MCNNLIEYYLNSSLEEQRTIRATVFEMYRDNFLTEKQYERFCELVY